MSLVNISKEGEPNIPQIPKITMANMGLLSRAVNMSAVINPNNLELEEFNNAMHNAGQDVWWLATTPEVYAAVCGSGQQFPTSIPGNMYCPRWDKVVMTTSPTLAITTLFHHITELHVETQKSNIAVLMGFRVNTIQQRHRLGNNVVNYFNRGYMAGTQCQIESGHRFNMTVDEAATVLVWNITAEGGGSIYNKIATSLSWQQGWLWMYNLPLPTQQITGSQHKWARAIFECLHYSGTGVLNMLPGEAQQAVNNILDSNHPLQQGVVLQHYGSKTRERIRGNPTIMEWVNSVTNFQEFVEAYNVYHTTNTDGGMNIDEDEDGNMEG